MADFVFPLEALKDDAVTILTAAGDTTPHTFGERGIAALGSAPRYVWVPTRTRDKNTTPTAKTEELRSIGQVREHVEVHCWGTSFRQAFALRNNLLVAVHRSVAVSAQIEGGQWIDPAQAWNQSGEVYVLELSLESPIADAFVDLTTLEQPEQSTELLTAADVDAYQSPDGDTDGELIVTVTNP